MQKIEKETPLIHPSLLRLLVCPVTGKKLTLDSDSKRLVCTSDDSYHALSEGNGDISYPIEEGIPLVLPQQEKTTKKYPT